MVDDDGDDGRVGDWKKRRWVGFEVAQQGVRSLGCGFRLVSAVRRGRAWGVSMFRVLCCGGVGEVNLYLRHGMHMMGALKLWEECRAVSAARAVGD